MKDKTCDSLNICEIFYSFQGESTFMGRPTVFIRLSECNLKCSICDTKYALRRGKSIKLTRILQIIRKIRTPYICITGGEPLLQKAPLKKLISELLRIKKVVSIETNGSISVKGLPKKAKLIVDIKTPSTMEQGSFLKENLTF